MAYANFCSLTQARNISESLLPMP